MWNVPIMHYSIMLSHFDNFMNRTYNCDMNDILIDPKLFVREFDIVSIKSSLDTTNYTQ